MQGGKIFDHLEMMEYYEYLKEFEESFISIFKKPETLLLRRERQGGPKLKESFQPLWTFFFDWLRATKIVKT